MLRPVNRYLVRIYRIIAPGDHQGFWRVNPVIIHCIFEKFTYRCPVDSRLADCCRWQDWRLLTGNNRGQRVAREIFPEQCACRKQCRSGTGRGIRKKICLNRIGIQFFPGNNLVLGVDSSNHVSAADTGPNRKRTTRMKTTEL